MSELEQVADRLKTVSYFELFGEGVTAQETQSRLKREYRRLVQVVHPDRHVATADKTLATEAFQRLTMLYQSATDALTTGTYGLTPLVTITTRRAVHRVGRVVKRGDVCDLHEATSVTSSEQATIFKLARLTADSDLLRNEADALKRLLGSDGDEKFYPFFPSLIESFAYDDGNGRRQVNVLERLEGWYTLQEVRQAFDGGLPAVHMVWIWRRLLWLLGYVHGQGIIHGAVLPSHVMILPQEHGVKLVDWCYNTMLPNDGAQFPPIKAIAPAFVDWYPQEVHERQTPTPGTDIYLAARCMVYLMGGDEGTQSLNGTVPKGIRSFFKGCCQAPQRLRPQDAWPLLEEFDELLERLGNPYYPRKFIPFAMPASA